MSFIVKDYAKGRANLRGQLRREEITTPKNPAPSCEMINFKAYLQRIIIDKEGEATVLLKVSRQEKLKAVLIPDNEILDVSVELEEKES